MDSGLPKLGRAKPACDESKAIKDNVYKEFDKTVGKMAEIIEYLDDEAYRADIEQTAKYVADGNIVKVQPVAVSSIGQLATSFSESVQKCK